MKNILLHDLEKKKKKKTLTMILFIFLQISPIFVNSVTDLFLSNFYKKNFWYLCDMKLCNPEWLQNSKRILWQTEINQNLP